MTTDTAPRAPQGLSGCGRYRALWSRYGGGQWLIFDIVAPSSSPPVASYRDAPGLSVARVLELFAQQRALAVR